MNDKRGALAVERECVIDLGTNSFHALIFELHPDRGPRFVDKLKETVRLGEGGLAVRKLTHRAVRRAEAALTRIVTLAERRGVRHTRAFATSAIREARNGEEFIRHIQRTLGLEIVPIPGEIEAKLIYRGVREYAALAEPSLIVDIGGGSTEFIVADASAMHLATSLKLGAARLTESMVKTDPISASELEALRGHVDAQLETVLETAREQGVRRLVGSSGTMENLGTLALRDTNQAGTVFQRVLRGKELLLVAEELIASSHEEREALSALDAHRVDQIVAGAVLVERLLTELSIEHVVISSAALREGMVLELVDELDGDFARTLEEPDLVRRRFLELGLRYRFDDLHAAHVAKLAVRLFDQLEPLHGLGPEARRVLDYAALIHDVGHAVSRRRHHKHTRYLVEQADWPGVDRGTVALAAVVARYHRRAVPKKKHRRYGGLDKKERRLVRQLAAILRLANALDRSHVQNTLETEVGIQQDVVHVTISTRADPELELGAAAYAVEAFERAFGRKLAISAAWHAASR